MKIDAALHVHVEASFAPLNTAAAASAFPAPASLSRALNAAIPKPTSGSISTNLSKNIAAMFATAAVDMWLRAVHSFLVSASLTSVSPIWASGSGYYSSHYAVRALAHLLGFFQLYTQKRIAQLQIRDGNYVCTFQPKTVNDREHRFYWKTVKRDQHFAGDPFFTDNDAAVDVSDVGHRDWANYKDHLPQFPMFRPLDEVALKTRVERISSIEITAPPIPRISRYPDLENVQVVAYHRVVRFRDLVDAILGGTNRFWRVHRTPPWVSKFTDFQVTEPATLRSRFTL